MNDQELPVTDLLAARRVPDAGPDFWTDLEAQLATEPAPLGEATTIARADDVDTELDSDGTGLGELQSRRTRRWLIATAAAIVAIVLGINALTEETGPAPLITENTTTTNPTTTATTTTTTQAPTTTVAAEPDTLPAPEPVNVEPVDVSSAVTTVNIGGPDTRQQGAGRVVTSAGKVWALAPALDGERPRAIVRLDPDTAEVISEIIIPGNYPLGLLATDSAIWIPVTDGHLHRLDPLTEEIVASTLIFEDDPGWFGGGDASADALWVSHLLDPRGPIGGGEPINVMRRVDPATNEVEAFVSIRESGWYSPVAISADAVWVGVADRVDRIDPTTNEVIAAIDLSRPGDPPADLFYPPDSLIIESDAVWVIDRQRVIRIDANSNTVTNTFEFPTQEDQGGGPTSALLDGDNLIVATRDHTLYRINTQTRTIEAAVNLGPDTPEPGNLALIGDEIWIDSDPSGFTTAQTTTLARIPVATILGAS